MIGKLVTPSLSQFVVGFGVLNAADLILTWLLIGHWQIAYEANPIGQRILRYWGWFGLCGFKLASTAGPVLAVKLIAPHRPWAARLICRVGMLAIIGVVFYSASLIAMNVDALQSLWAAQNRGANITRDYEACSRYSAAANSLAGDLVDGRRSLASAVFELSKFRHEGQILLKIIQSYTGPLSENARMAVDLVRRAGMRVNHNTYLAARILRRLANEYRAMHSELPEFATEPYGQAPQ